MLSLAEYIVKMLAELMLPHWIKTCMRMRRRNWQQWHLKCTSDISPDLPPIMRSLNRMRKGTGLPPRRAQLTCRSAATVWLPNTGKPAKGTGRMAVLGIPTARFNIPDTLSHQSNLNLLLWRKVWRRVPLLFDRILVFWVIQCQQKWKIALWLQIVYESTFVTELLMLRAYLRRVHCDPVLPGRGNYVPSPTHADRQLVRSYLYIIHHCACSVIK